MRRNSRAGARRPIKAKAAAGRGPARKAARVSSRAAKGNGALAGTRRAPRAGLAKSRISGASPGDAAAAGLNREKLALTFAEIGICEFELRPRMVRVSETAKHLLGMRGPDLDIPYDRYLESLHPDDRRTFDDVLQRCIAGTGGLDIEYRVMRPDGAMRWLRTKGDALLDLDAKPVRVFWIIEDISQRRETDARVRFLAHHDLLTGLPNRTLFQDRLYHAIAAARRMDMRVGLLFIDLDRFKLINDSFGHRIGDALLQSAAERMRHCVRETDTLCRHSGDEYLIALSALREPGEAAVVANKVIQAFERPFLIEGQEISVGVSIGIAVFPEDGKTLDELVRNADAAMYLAKRSGRKRFEFFKSEMHAPAAERLLLGNQLRRGIEEGQLLLHFQPQFEIANGRLIAAEALLRWVHPERGLMSAEAFIPIAEESDLINVVGEWVLNEVCRRIAQWKHAGRSVVPIAINFSAFQFRRSDLVHRVANALSRHAIEAAHLEIELTENAIMQDPKETAQILETLSEMGVTLTIDDFGTGYSSLSYLKRFAIDKLKVDRSFITDLPYDLNDASITQAIVSLARNLEISVVAEGVENKEQLEFLHGIGCFGYQGYFGARPEDAETFGRRLSD